MNKDAILEVLKLCERNKAGNILYENVTYYVNWIDFEDENAPSFIGIYFTDIDSGDGNIVCNLDFYVNDVTCFYNKKSISIDVKTIVEYKQLSNDEDQLFQFSLLHSQNEIELMEIICKLYEIKKYMDIEKTIDFD